MPGPYSTDTDLLKWCPAKILVQLTDDEKKSTNQNSLTQSITDNAEVGTRIVEARAEADEEIDAYVSKRVTLPVVADSSFPKLVRRLSCSLTIWNLYSRKRGEFSELPKAVTDDHDETVGILKAVSKGEMHLGKHPQAANSPSVQADAASEEALFTQTTLEDF